MYGKTWKKNLSRQQSTVHGWYIATSFPPSLYKLYPLPATSKQTSLVFPLKNIQFSGKYSCSECQGPSLTVRLSVILWYLYPQLSVLLMVDMESYAFKIIFESKRGEKEKQWNFFAEIQKHSDKSFSSLSACWLQHRQQERAHVCF